MKPLGVRARVLMAALLPIALVAVLLGVVFLVGRVDDLDTAHQQRALALARQMASNAEFGLFAGNVEALKSVANAGTREQDVRAVGIIGRDGKIAAQAGHWTGGEPSVAEQTSDTRESVHGMTRRVIQPIVPTEVPLERWFGETFDAVHQPPVLGYVVLDVSRESLIHHESLLVLAGVLVTLGGLIFGSLLAVRLSRQVTSPIVHVSEVVERFGRGELSVRVKADAASPIYALEEGINDMARRIEQSHEELAQRIDEATTELRSKKDEAEQATIAKSRFLAAASHDLRQPMHALGMFVAHLRQMRHDPETARLVENIDASVLAMQDLLDALLDISRLDAGVVKPTLQAFPVSQLWEALRSEIGTSAQEKQLTLRLRPSELWLMSDPSLLHRIMLNVASNAVRYTRRGGVLIDCRRRGNRALLEVWDTGIGIPPEAQSEVFKEFVQLDNPERDRSKGLGLGLAIVERTAQLLGHPINLNSIPGKGTRLRIEVPIAEPVPVVTPSEPSVPHVELSGVTVLVIDDDARGRRALADLLTSWGCLTVVAATGAEAIGKATTIAVPDVIASDYRLPDNENGIRLVRRLREAFGRDVPAFLVSGDTAPSVLAAAKEAGLPLVHKPARPARLRTVIQSLLKVR
jgi:signal transduction histidine kinase